MAAPEKQASPRRFRSPPYPYIPLRKAVERAAVLYHAAPRFPVDLADLADVWGYGRKSSGVPQTAAALLHFGLLSDQGSGSGRVFRLTDDALHIIQDTAPHSAKRQRALKRAALAPRIHAELWERFGDPHEVSRAVLIDYLTADRSDRGDAPFSPTAADDLLTEYRQTLAFAGLVGADDVVGDYADAGDHDAGLGGSEETRAFPARRAQSPHEDERVLTTGLLSPHASFRLMVSGPVGVREIELLIRKLELDKEILAGSSDGDEPSS